MRYFISFASIATLVFVHSASVCAHEIVNRFLRVTWEGQAATIRSVSDESTIVRRFRFPWKVEDSETRELHDPIYGTGQSIALTHEGGWQSTLMLLRTSPFLHCSTQLRNQSEQSVEINSLPYVEWINDLGIETSELRVLGTGGLTSASDAKGSYTFSAVAEPDSRRGIVAGWLTHEQGIGAFFPSVHEDSLITVSRIDFGHFQVQSGESRATEVLLIGCMEDVRAGLEAYADSIVKKYGIELPVRPGVYCTWYHALASNELKLAANTRFAAETLKSYGLSVMQIDDKWQTIVPNDRLNRIDTNAIAVTGPYKVFTDANENFPAGMEAMAKVITDHGMTAGIWFMPFAGNFRNPTFDQEVFATNADGTPFHDSRWSGTCIDMSHPKGESFVRQRVRRIYDWGYRYFKIDGMHTGIPSYNVYVNTSYIDDRFGDAKLHNPMVTHAQAYRKGLTVLREEAPETFILGCNVSQNMRSMGPAFGLIDGMRIGPDNGNAGNGSWDEVILGAWHGTNLYFLNNRVWYNDPDPVYVRASNPIESARWMCSWMAVAGAMHTSSEQYADLPADRLDLLKRCLPCHNFPARPVDLMESSHPRIWLVKNERFNLVGLFNWNAARADSIRYDLARLGLTPAAEYVAFDYWANQFVPRFHGTLEQTLPAGTCRVLAIKPVADHPQLLATSRHITQGLIDVKAEAWDASSRTLRGQSDVVAGDEYELRLVLPNSELWTVRTASANGEPLLTRPQPGDPRHTLRMHFTPRATQTVDWVIQF